MTPQEANELLLQDLKLLVHDADSLLQATAGEVNDQVQDARNRLAERLHKTKSAYERWQDRTVEAARATGRVMRAHPYETAGTVLGLALLISALLVRPWCRTE